jgi:hypothetical protein
VRACGRVGVWTFIVGRFALSVGHFEKERASEGKERTEQRQRWLVCRLPIV